ncbi:DUF1461 domain-containing protein [Candidatus Woesearchaeota archaeon]|nr:DUF1461 domain-containing protein [Candidatus Woesearchaeota archaeon]MBL7050989.1 DUF1461 domain-containing protein [Candidatus Woesearchaeota archaeon]
MNHKINPTTSILSILIICLPIIIIISSANSIIFSDSTYITIKETEFKEETTNNILNYFKNNQELLTQPEFTQREFTQKEFAHMADVKKVIKNMNSFLLINIILSTLLLLHISTKLNNKEFKKFLSKYLKTGGIITLIIISTLFILTLNFDFTFNLFHSLLFQPGTWIFPENSILIQLFPITFFQQTAIAIFNRIFISAMLLLIVGFSLKKLK